VVIQQLLHEGNIFVVVIRHVSALYVSALQRAVETNFRKLDTYGARGYPNTGSWAFDSGQEIIVFTGVCMLRCGKASHWFAHDYSG
jgi:hypothetical protein